MIPLMGLRAGSSSVAITCNTSAPGFRALGHLGAVVVALVAGVFWIRAYGVAVGSCCWLAALTAAASINTVVAPFSAWTLLALTAASALLLAAGLVVLVGT